jgi:hypothetical protein
MPTEKTYTVQAKSLTGFGRIVYSKGDTVRESDFPKGNALEFESSGILVSDTPKKKQITSSESESIPVPEIKEVKKKNKKKSS